MGRYTVGDKVMAQRALSAPHEPATVVATPVYETPRTLDGQGGERIQQVTVEFEDGVRQTVVADSPAISPLRDGDS